MRLQHLFTSLAGAALLLSCSGNSVIEDFEHGLDNWTPHGDVFQGTSQGGDATGYQGAAYLKSVDVDALSGSLTSSPFKIAKPYINMLVGGPRALGFGGPSTAIRLLVDGQEVRTATSISAEPNNLEWISWDVKDLIGKEASIKIDIAPARTFGTRRMPRGYLLVDQIQQGPKRLSSFFDEYAVTL